MPVLPSTLLCCTVLYVLPASPSVALAQEPGRIGQDATAAAPLQFTVGAMTVRRWADGAGGHVALSRDGGSSWVELAPPDDLVRTVHGDFDPLLGLPAYPGALAVPPATRLHVVQFHTQVLSEYRVAVARAGVEILHFLPASCLVVRADARALAAVRALPCVRWTGAMPNAWKLDTETQAFALGAGAARELNLVLAAKKDRATLAGQVKEIGGTVTELCDGSILIRAALTPAQLAQVMSLDTFVWADPVTATGTDMDNARIQGGANYVESLAGLLGNGVRAEITEGFEETHPDFVGRFLVRSDGLAAHGHCTAGIVGGAGAGNPAARGMMPSCTIIENYYGSSGAHYANIQGSVDAASPMRSMQATASWGSQQTTAYTSISASVDDALFDFDFVRTQSMSNLGAMPPNPPQSCRPEAWPKNIISVGGIRHLNNSNPLDDFWYNSAQSSAASIGPASDGRLKPEIVAYYDSVLTSDLTGTFDPLNVNQGGYSPTDYYSSFSGTSSATPIVSGHVGLIQEMYTNGLFGNPLPLPATAANRWQNRPHMSTVKALLCNTAAQYTFSGTTADLTRTHVGWGFPSLQRLYDNRDKIVVLDEYDTLQVGQTRTHLVYIAPGTPEFRVTMVYTDPSNLALAAVHLINDLNLKVTRMSDGVFWWGNNGLAAGNFSTSGGAANNRDNLEAVYLQNPVAGMYRIDISALSIAQDAKVETPQIDADFALAMHPMGGGYRTTGGLTCDLTSTGPGNLTFHASNVPAAGWTEGFTVMSFNTSRAVGFGRIFGIEDDGLTGMLWSTAAAPGNPYHFTNTSGVYPFASFVYPDPGLISVLAGLKVDAMIMLWNGASLVAVSNIDRITLQ